MVLNNLGKPKTKRGPGRPRKEIIVIDDLDKEVPKPEPIEDSELTSVEELGKSRRKRKLPVRYCIIFFPRNVNLHLC